MTYSRLYLLKFQLSIRIGRLKSGYLIKLGHVSHKRRKHL